MARRGPFLPRDIAEAAIDDTTPAPVAMPRAFEVDAVDQEASGFGRGPRAFQVASYDEGYQPPAYNPSQPDPLLQRTPGLTPVAQNPQFDPRDPYGIRAPYQGAPADAYAASSSVGETLRNVGGVFNPFSENSVFGSFYQGENPVLQELARPSNYVGAGAGVRGLARGALSGVGGRFLGEAAMEALPEDANPLLKGAVGLGAGLVGGGIGYRAVDDVPRVAGMFDQFITPAVFPPEASQIGRVPGTDPAWTAGVLGEEVGPTGNVTEMLLGREPRVGENVNARRYYTNLGRSEQAALAADEQAAFRSASERAIAGAMPDDARGIGGGADLGDLVLPPQGRGPKDRLRALFKQNPDASDVDIRAALTGEPQQARMPDDEIGRASFFEARRRANDVLDRVFGEDKIYDDLRREYGGSAPPPPRTGGSYVDAVVAERQAVQQFGVTTDRGKAGYVLGDGRLLDFSDGGPGRYADHRSIGAIDALDAVPAGAGDTTPQMLAFQEATGAIRLLPEQNGASIVGNSITRSQFRELQARIGRGEALTLDLEAPNGVVRHSFDVRYRDQLEDALKQRGVTVRSSRRLPSIGGGADITPGEFARLAAKKAAGEALTPDEQDLEDALSRARQVGGGADIPGDAPLTPTGTQSVTPQTYTAPPTLRRLFGARDIVPGETRGALERVAEEGRFRADDPIVTPALRVRDEARRAVVNQATRVTAQARTLINRAGFEFDDVGRIKALAGIDPEVPGAPTLRDVAARLPRYAEALTPPQRQALERIRELVAPYRQALDEVAQAESALTGKPSSIKIGSRADVMDGGFYIPRGNAETEALAEIAAKRVGRGGGRVGGRQGFEKSAQFASEAEGIAAGYRYTPIDEALASYVRGAGNRALDRHTANYFLSRVDESGQRIAQSRADRLDPELRGAVESVRSRIASRLQTLRNQTVRGRAQQQAATDAERAAQRVERLAVSAETRALLKKAKIEEFDVSTPDAILESFPDMDALRAQADATRARLATRSGERGLAQRLGEQEALIALRAAAEQSGGDLDRMLDIVNEFGEQSARYSEAAAPRGRMTGATAPAFGTPERVQWELDRAASGIKRQRGGTRSIGVDAPFYGPDAAYRTYDAILAHAMDNSAVWVLRTPSTESAIRAADRELRVLLREARAAERNAQTAGVRSARTEAQRAATQQEIVTLQNMRDELANKWQQAQQRAAQTPRDRGSIPLAGLDAYAFPYEMADEAARVLQRETRDPGTVDAALRAVNGVFRGIQATGEMSYLGIQNLMGTVADPVAGYRAAKASTQAWLNAGDEVLGDFIARFDAKAAGNGLPDSERWAASGLRLGAAGTEFRVGGRKVPERIANVVESRPVQLATAPVRSLVNRAERGFGVAGDTMRLELADTLAEESMLAGRTLDDKTLRSIAETANRVTGWTPQRAFGDWGEVANFAPRYLAARARALGQLASADPYKRDLARRIVGRYLMIASTMTIAANYLNGEETDYHPFSGKNGPTYDPRDAEYKNPNFMRVMNVAKRDWSLLGPMDALLGTAVGAASLLTNPTGDPKEMLKRMRSILTSPSASAGLDWVVFGENFEREKLTLDSEAGLRDLMGRVLPFGAGDLGYSAVETARLAQDKRGVEATTEGVAGVVQGFVGGRASLETAREGVERGRFGEMTPGKQFKAIPAQAWMVTVKQAPEQFKAVSQYATAGAFYRALVDEYTKGWIERGASPLEAEAEARASAARHPVYQAYNNARNYYENWWTEQNPEQREAEAEEQKNLPPSERRNMPRQQELQIIREATR